MKNPTGKNIISSDNYELYFNKILASKGIEIQNDVLLNGTLKANWLKSTSVFFFGIISTAIMMYNYMSLDTKARAACLMAAGSSTMLNRTNTLVNYGFDEDIGKDPVSDKNNQSEHLNEEKIKLNNGETSVKPIPGWTKSHSERALLVVFGQTLTKSNMYEKYKNKNTRNLNEKGKGRNDLYDLYDKNKKLSGDPVHQMRDRLAWRGEQISTKKMYI